jgi:uncharacterized SAM-binding protein YcdF (DUF218 family)
MLFFKILQQLLLPSSFILVLILIGLILWLVSKKKKLGKILMIAGILLYYLFSITTVSNCLLLPLENKYSPLSEEEMEKADEIVLLLGGKEADVLRGSEVLRISYLRDREVKIIISGTDPLLPTSEEALGVKKFFVSRGLEEENIIIEGRSRNTWENIRNVKEIVGEEPFFLVTSAYHMERAKREFEKVEANFIPAPTDFKVKTEKYNALDFFPDAQNLRNSDLAVHEYLGILWYNFVY